MVGHDRGLAHPDRGPLSICSLALHLVRKIAGGYPNSIGEGSHIHTGHFHDSHQSDDHTGPEPDPAIAVTGVCGVSNCRNVTV